MSDPTTDDDARSCSEVDRDLEDEDSLENENDLEDCLESALKSGLFSSCFFDILTRSSDCFSDILTRSDQNLS
jgi:hypothetical protein